MKPLSGIYFLSWVLRCNAFVVVWEAIPVTLMTGLLDGLSGNGYIMCITHVLLRHGTTVLFELVADNKDLPM